MTIGQFHHYTLTLGDVSVRGGAAGPAVLTGIIIGLEAYGQERR